MDRILIPVMPKKVQPSSEFGERLTALRKARGLTQVQLAEMIGSTQRAVSRYETIADRAPEWARTAMQTHVRAAEVAAARSLGAADRASL